MRKQIIFFLMLFPALIMAEPLDKVVAIVNDDVITASELSAQVEVWRKQVSARNKQVPPEPILRKQVLQHLIDIDLQLQLAKNNNITVDSIDLNEALAKIAASNKLSLTQLREAVTQQGLDWETYRENIRKELLISQIQQKAVGNEVFISPKQIEEYLKTPEHDAKTQQLFHLENLVITLPDEPTTEQVKKAWTKANLLLTKIKRGNDLNSLAIAEPSGEFPLESGDLGDRHLAELPEVFAKKVVGMKLGEVAGPLRTGNGFQLIKLVSISDNKERHEVTKTHVRHILLKQAASMTNAEASKQINNLYEQLKSGKDFAVMAKQYSLDLTSAVKGGDLGWVTPEVLIPEFAKAMDALPLHTVSQPVKTAFGWHLIEVLERKTVDDSETFKRQQVRQFLHQRKFTEAVQNWQQHMRADAYVNVLEKDLA